MRLQPYSIEYEAGLIALHRSALEGISHGISDDDEEQDLRSIQATYIDGGGEFLIGFIDGDLIAMGGFKLSEAGVAELKRLRISPSLQGSGVGTQLLAALEASAGAKDVTKLVLETSARREKTLAFWRRRGYVETGEGLYGTERVLYFEKRLE